MYFPTYRMRRMRRTPTLRRMMRETALSPDDLIYPLFVSHGENVKRPIPSMPGCEQLSIGNLLPEVREIAAARHSRGAALRHPRRTKTRAPSSAYDPEGVVQLAIRAIKDEVPDLVVITDVCLCEYMDHGHCGVVQDGEIVTTTPRSSCWPRWPFRHAEAGADIVAPSDMMDGRVAAIRAALDDEGFTDTADHGLLGQVRLGFLRPLPRRRRVAPRSSATARPTRWTRPTAKRPCARSLLDIEEGADIVMVKPALAYLDVVRRCKQEFQVPARRLQRERRVRHDQGGGANGWLDERRVRAGGAARRSSGPAPTSSSPITPKTRCAGCKRRLQARAP